MYAALKVHTTLTPPQTSIQHTRRDPVSTSGVAVYGDPHASWPQLFGIANARVRD